VTDDEIMHVVRYSTVGSNAIQTSEWCAFARALLSASKPAVAKSCQTGWADICHMAKHDGVTCPDDSCDIDDDIRAAPAQSGEPVATPAFSEASRDQ
jgi:hypothetical protein